MQLVPYARRWYKMASIRFSAVAQVSLATWVLMPQRAQEAIPIQYVIAFALVCLALAVLGSLIKQPKVSGE